MSTAVVITGTAGTKLCRMPRAPIPAEMPIPSHQRRSRNNLPLGSARWSGTAVMGKGSFSSPDQRRRTMRLMQRVTQSVAETHAVHQSAGASQARSTSNR